MNQREVLSEDAHVQILGQFKESSQLLLQTVPILRALTWLTQPVVPSPAVQAITMELMPLLAAAPGRQRTETFLRAPPYPKEKDPLYLDDC